MAPREKMMFKADVNRIYDEEYYSEQKIKQEKFFIRPSRQRKMKKTKWFSIGMGIDLPFCIIILILLTIGTIMMFSASYAFSYYTQGDSYYYLVRQLIFIALGLVGMTIMSFFNYNKLHKIAPVVLGVAYVALVVVLILPGTNGVKRWIPLGMFNIQPSEIAKFAIILFFAHWASKYYNKMQSARYSVLPGVVVFGTTALLLFLEPHYSGIVIIAMLTVLMLYIGGMKTKYLIVGFAIMVGLVLILAMTGGLSYAMSRMDGWGQALEYTTEDMWQATWQTRNSLYAIGSGGLWGLGLGQSRQKYLYLPEPQNDFIFAIVVEELGLIGATMILLIFALLVWRGITLSLRAKDKFGKLLGIGLTSQIGIQVVLNILVITDWLPNTGISLPFFSYGGSSLIMLLAQMGIVLSISRTANIERQ
ncbi:MAG: putative peptidoglycan glycosyltransferase FtsW [Ruminococcus sp.]|nr:putative peptidoglycan glycosyltransferase FtsW [Ruminococcus sp.]